MSFHDIYIPTPITEAGLILRRDSGLVMTNIPHKVVRHSPDGFEWGYGGSGPSDLALNAVEHILDVLRWKGPRIAVGYKEGTMFVATSRMYRIFLDQFIASAPRAGGVVPWSTLHPWVDETILLFRKACKEGNVDPDRHFGYLPGGHLIPGEGS